MHISSTSVKPPKPCMTHPNTEVNFDKRYTRLAFGSSGPVQQLRLGFPRLKLRTILILMLKTYLRFVKYSMNTIYIRNLIASNYVLQIIYLRVSIFYFCKKTFILL